MDNAIVLSASIKQGILDANKTKDIINLTSSRLGTGKKINSVQDDPYTYFLAQSLNARAAMLEDRKQEIDQGINTLAVVVDATASLEAVIGNMIGVVVSARSARSGIVREAARDQLTILAQQFQRFIDDTSYQGINLVMDDASELVVQYSDRDESKLVIKSENLSISRAFRNTANVALSMAYSNTSQIDAFLGFSKAFSEYDFTNTEELNTFISSTRIAQKRLEATGDYIRSTGARFGNQITILRIRVDFTNKYVNTLEGGSDKMTLANLTEEGANMRVLRLRQQLGMQAITFSASAEDAILQLLR